MVAGSRERLQLEVSGDVMVDRSAGSDRSRSPLPFPKGDRLDWMVQKLTELGADRLVLLHAERFRPVGRRTSRPQHDRAVRVSLEACRRAVGVWSMRDRRCRCPRSRCCQTCVVAEPGGRPVVSSDDTDRHRTGGRWSNAELEATRGTVSLGANILRVETAAIAAATLRAVLDH